MRGVRRDAFVLGRLLKASEPKLYKKLQEAGIDGMIGHACIVLRLILHTASMFASNWLLPLYVRILPWPSLLRVIDLLLFGEPVSSPVEVAKAWLSWLSAVVTPAAASGPCYLGPSARHAVGSERRSPSYPAPSSNGSLDSVGTAANNIDNQDS